jgi:superfamily II DNA/RNA helicase
MPLTAEQIANYIAQATEPRFRGRLVSRGLSRSVLWREGALPEGAPNFAITLTSDLLDYGFGLFHLCLQLRALDKGHPLLSRAFERAAESIEAVVRRGDPNLTERGFFTVVAAAAYHLGHFSARAFSLFVSGTRDDLNLSPSEVTLRGIFVRDLASVQSSFGEVARAGGFDAFLAERYRNAPQDAGADSLISFLLEAHFQRALSCFEHALETGDVTSYQNSLGELDSGMRACDDFQHVTFWWLFAIARHLLDDLWDYSLHVRLPHAPDAPKEQSWNELRKFFIATLVKRSVSEVDLWPSQLNAVARAFDINDDLIVSLPTSAGKTRVAEVCILRTLSLSQRVVFVTPLRALSAQTERTLRRTFMPLGFSVSSLYGSSGMTGEDRDSLGNRDIVITTPEKLDFALRNNPTLLDQVGLIVLDEGHCIGREEREIRYEVLVQRLLRREDAARRRIVCLSALLPSGDDLNDFVGWLRQDHPGEAVTCDWRATRQRFGHVVWQRRTAKLSFRVDSETPYVPSFLVEKRPRGKRKKAFPQNSQEFTMAVAWRFADQGQTVLIYCPQRRSVESLADLALKLKRQGYLESLLPNLSDEQQLHLKEATNIGTEWLGAFHPAVQCLELGVAVHHGTLPRPFQRAIEKLLRDHVLSVIVASPTLAQGLNLSATTLLFHSLYRNQDIIPAEEFINVAGRAGRAFVDVEGQVVCVDFENRLRNHWQKLIDSAQKRNLTSGLFRLVIHLCRRVHARTGLPIGRLVEYIGENRDAWKAPEPTKEEPRLPQVWELELARLDSAILALLPHEIDVAALAQTLDTALNGSLWQRSLVRAQEPTQRAAKTLLKARAQFIWTQSTPVQRKGAYFAGVSFSTGLKLSDHAERLNALLTAADAQFAQGNTEDATLLTLEFAKIVFQISPFDPDELPGDWEKLTTAWIYGHNLSDIAGGIEGDIVEFIENALVYKLVWALEAVRVRAIASEELDESDLNGFAAMAVETGTPSYAASLLIHSGLASRIAAIKAVTDVPTTFTDTQGMKQWINSEAIKSREADPQWPTEMTASLWKDFVEGLSRETTRKWSARRFETEIHWTSHPLRTGSSVRITNGTSVFSITWEPVGSLARPVLGQDGITIARVGATGNTIVGEYLGPRG